MPDTPRNYEHELLLIYNAMAESVAETPAEELWAECREAGVDVEAAANETRHVIESAVKRYEQRRLIKAREQHNSRVAAMAANQFKLPDSISDRRNLLSSIFQQMPEYRGLLTAQCRDFRDLPDEEVKSILGNLQELGVLERLRPGTDSK